MFTPELDLRAIQIFLAVAEGKSVKKASENRNSLNLIRIYPQTAVRLCYSMRAKTYAYKSWQTHLSGTTPKSKTSRNRNSLNLIRIYPQTAVRLCYSMRAKTYAYKSWQTHLSGTTPKSKTSRRVAQFSAPVMG